jgi:hypothetical protein
MFNEIVEIDKDGNAFLEDNTISVLPHLWAVYKKKHMGSKMVKFIIAVEDYHSPYRRLPAEQRLKTVTYNLFETKRHKLCEDPMVLLAREEYRMMQYDPLIDQYRAMTDQMFEITKIFRAMKPNNQNLDEINDMQIKMQKAADARSKIKEMIIKDQEGEHKIAGTSSDDFSFLEQGQRLEKGD